MYYRVSLVQLVKFLVVELIYSVSNPILFFQWQTTSSSIARRSW
jgi:hypothetical protein